MVIGKILYLSHSAKLIRVGINTTIEDVYQHMNNLSVFLFSLLMTLVEPIIKIRIVVVEIKLEVIRFILIFFAKVFKVMVKGAMRTESVYGTLPSVSGRTIKITV
jgi:2-C-methyl-D-erythritol 4-phosphate cytidylyltransferase